MGGGYLIDVRGGYLIDVRGSYLIDVGGGYLRCGGKLPHRCRGFYFKDVVGLPQMWGEVTSDVGESYLIDVGSSTSKTWEGYLRCGGEGFLIKVRLPHRCRELCLRSWGLPYNYGCYLKRCEGVTS